MTMHTTYFKPVLISALEVRVTWGQSSYSTSLDVVWVAAEVDVPFLPVAGMFVWLGEVAEQVVAVVCNVEMTECDVFLGTEEYESEEGGAEPNFDIDDYFGASAPWRRLKDKEAPETITISERYPPGVRLAFNYKVDRLHAGKK